MKKVLIAAVAATTLFAGRAEAQYNPFGVQQNVLVSTVTNGGWAQCYTATMSVFIGYAAENVLNSCTQTNIMMAGRATGSDILLVLAAGNRAAVTQNTGAVTNQSTSNLVNGSQWYFSDNWSWGFAQGGAETRQNQCDELSGAQRMCLHTVNAVGGYRIGDFTGLNDSGNYEKVFFQQVGSGVTVTPEPASIALVGAGMLAMLGFRRRRARKA